MKGEGEEGRRFTPRGEVRRNRVAGAHKLARIVWAMIVSGQPYSEAKAFATTPTSLARRLKNLQHQAHALNLTLVPIK